jgi:putative tryptophan/tyrosine transport system substrate-binding protein
MNPARRRLRLLLVAAGLFAALHAGAQPTKPGARIAVLCANRCDVGPGIEALREALRSAGWVEGKTLHIEYRGAGLLLDRLPSLAQELVALKPDLIVAYSPQPSRAAKNATSTIPIVFIAVADPVRVGLVDSLVRPGGNLTGVATFVPGGFMAKGLETLKQAVPHATRIAALINPGNDVAMSLLSSEAPNAARQLGVTLQVVEARTPDDIEPAIQAAVEQRADALWVIGDPIFGTPARRIPDLAAKFKLPAMYLFRDQVVVGGLMSYGPDYIELARRGAAHIDKILKGARPADLPVEQPTRFQLVVNLNTAKALGITIPKALLLRVDEAIE